MSDWLKKIQQKPKSYRKKLAYIITGLLGVLVCFLWLIVTSNNIKKSMGGNGDFSETLKRETRSLKEKQQEITGEKSERSNSLEKESDNKKGKDSEQSYKDLQ
jgi:hypothetical protein